MLLLLPLVELGLTSCITGANTARSTCQVSYSTGFAVVAVGSAALDELSYRAIRLAHTIRILTAALMSAVWARHCQGLAMCLSRTCRDTNMGMSRGCMCLFVRVAWR
jgi:hypothetical protein